RALLRALPQSRRRRPQPHSRLAWFELMPHWTSDDLDTPRYRGYARIAGWSMASFKHDIFISYAHADNRGGWVDEFHSCLANRLGVLGVKPRIWPDKKLGGADVFSDEILDNLKRSALLVSVLSPNGMQSNWCEKERRQFEWYADAGLLPRSSTA